MMKTRCLVQIDIRKFFKLDISKEECKIYNQVLTLTNWQNFDEMMNCIYSINRVIYDEVNWALSNFSCSFWSKNYKCYHIIAISARKKKGKFIRLALTFQFNPTEKKGRQKNTIGALVCN